MNESTSTVSTTETQDPIGVPLVDTDNPHEHQLRQQRSPHQHIRPLSTAPTAEWQPCLCWEQSITEQGLHDFVREVRHQPTLLPPRPLGFRNPRSLCYRNAVVVALLHSRRFVAFLHVYARRSSILADGPASALLTRFHALAMVYWEVGGSGNGRCETLHALLWRACNKIRVDCRPCQSWQAVCLGQDTRLQDQETTVVGGSGEPNNTPLWFWEQQQDAVAFWNWLVERARAELLAASPRVAANWFGAMFDVLLETRQVDGRCRLQPERRQPGTTTRQVGLKVHVGTDSVKGGKTKTLDDLLTAFFSEDQRQPRRRLVAAPELLPVHLMRVGDDAQGRPVVKHQTAVDVPALLDVSRWLAPHVFAAGSRVVYRLSTVVSHCGRDAQSGHYVAHVRCGGDGGGWARVDDQKVTLGVPFGQITNVQAPTASDDNRFDPVLLVYEKWIAQYAYAGGPTAARRRRRWCEDEATAHVDRPAAKKPRS